MTYEVGQIYWEAHALLFSQPWDMGEHGSPCATEEEAEENAEYWLSWLSDREKKNAVTWVTRYRVVEVDEDGAIMAATTCHAEDTENNHV